MNKKKKGKTSLLHHIKLEINSYNSVWHIRDSTFSYIGRVLFFNQNILPKRNTIILIER